MFTANFVDVSSCLCFCFLFPWLVQQYGSVTGHYLLCWVACSLLHDVRSCIGSAGRPLVRSHHASHSQHLLRLWGRLLTIRGRWRHLSWRRTEKYSDWRENDCTWSKDLSGRVGAKSTMSLKVMSAGYTNTGIQSKQKGAEWRECHLRRHGVLGWEAGKLYSIFTCAYHFS